MKKILIIIIFTFFSSTALYAKSISYICEVSDNNNSKAYKEIFEVKNNKFFTDGELQKTTSIKLNNTNIEVNYLSGSTKVNHKVNFKNGIGFEIWSKDTDSIFTYHLNCSVI